MIDGVLDDTHLCIKCSATIDGLENYIQHRRLTNCGGNATHHQKLAASQTPVISDHSSVASLNHSYDSFNFPSPVASSNYARKSDERSKISKSALNDCYDLAYELGADVFFSSLQLQSVQAPSSTVASPCKADSHSQSITSQLQRSKSLPTDQQVVDVESGAVAVWIDNHHHVDVTGIGDEKKSLESIFTPIEFASEELQESPDVSDEEDDEDVDVEADSVHAVPPHHTGGKWKPGCTLSSGRHSRIHWSDDMHADDLKPADTHPPAGHTRGKWVPGTKMQRLEYKEEVQLVRPVSSKCYFRCNICCRNLKSKHIYENHLQSNYHRKRAETEQQLERAAIDELMPGEMAQRYSPKPKVTASTAASAGKTKRRRQAALVKCELCNYTMYRRFIGKHLISHYHYRRMQSEPCGSLQMILDNIHAVVLQAPFQCRPCRFYANTPDTFLLHWRSAWHEQCSRGPGNYCCSYCSYECESNEEMLVHLVSERHREVVLAINRSVPICISKKETIWCDECGDTFRYNMELRQHMQLRHAHIPLTVGTASNSYQGREQCDICLEYFHTKVALQRHEKYHHNFCRYFCSICKLEFETALEARRHRKTFRHRQQAMIARVAARRATALPKQEVKLQDKALIKCKDCNVVCSGNADLKVHRDISHPLLKHMCHSCGKSFAVAQALGRHSRTCVPPQAAASNSTAPTAKEDLQSSWQCADCSFSADYESELIYHRLHHTYGPNSMNQLIDCPLCTKKFSKHSLRCHLRQHTNEKIFGCDVCGVKFARRHNLKDHIKKMHASCAGVKNKGKQK